MWKKLFSLALCCSLFVPITIHASDDLILGGDSIGIQLDYDGVMVSGTYVYRVKDNDYDPSKQIQSGDIITNINQERIHTIEDLYTQLGKFQNDINQVPITIQRQQEKIDTTLTTVYDDKEATFKSGLYVKDKIVGIGTMTYYDPQYKTYGALGHEIYDVDIKQIADVHAGSIYPAIVTSIQKAQNNVAGEKHAQIDYNTPIADVTINREIGIYGHYNSLPKSITNLSWAKQAEMKTGSAMIYTVLDQDTIEAYEIKITKLNKQASTDVKGIEFIVVDERLKQLTNGIIQGMSGSPIVQDGKIIGAVTHVITSNPTNGYGVYIEWMLEKSRNLS